MAHLARGIRSAIVLFRTSPLAAFSGTIALALGIGFSTTMFTIVRGATSSLPFTDADSIVAITKVPIATASASQATRGSDVLNWRSHVSHLIDIEAFTTQAMNLGDPGTAERRPERVDVASVTPLTFARLGASSATGRTFLESDAVASGSSVALISFDLWHRRFGGAADVLGRTLRLNGQAHEVIGVMPVGFGFPIRSDVWLPLQPTPNSVDALQAWGRLRPGTSRASAAAALSATIARLAEDDPRMHRGLAADVIPFTEIETPREVIAALYVLLAAVTGVLVIACVNVANLFIARAAGRRRDIAVRLALGASRRVLLTEQTGEALVFSVAGLVGGMGMASVATTVFEERTAHIIEAFWVDFAISPAVVGWAGGLAVLSAIAAAVLPALRSARTDVVQTLRDGGGTTGAKLTRTSRILVTAQIAFACGVLALTLLLGRSALALQSRAWPFAADNIQSAQVSIPASTFSETDGRTRIIDALIQELDSTVTMAGALTTHVPGRGAGNPFFAFDGSRSAIEPRRAAGTTGFTLVSERYFEVLGASARRGRVFTSNDREGAPAVAVVNESFAARFSADQDPIGRQISFGGGPMTIVGVVPDLMMGDIQDRRQDGVYGAIRQHVPYAVTILAASASGTLPSVRSLEAVVERVNPDWPLVEAMPVKAAALRDKEVLSVLSGLFGIFGGSALALTALGLYSVMMLLLAMRTREFGVRLALGATRRDLIRLVAGQGGRQVGVGVAIGALLALGLTRMFANAVENVTFDAWWLLSGVILALTLTAAAALATPVWMAARLNPVQALKAD